jgi:hypothetical protein
MVLKCALLLRLLLCHYNSVIDDFGVDMLCYLKIMLQLMFLELIYCNYKFLMQWIWGDFSLVVLMPQDSRHILCYKWRSIYVYGIEVKHCSLFLDLLWPKQISYYTVEVNSSYCWLLRGHCEYNRCLVMDFLSILFFWLGCICW